MQYRRVTREDLDGIMSLCEAEGWPSYTADREHTWGALTAPGVYTVVAIEAGTVVGFAQMQSDGLIQAHLSLIAVARHHRRQGIGRRLVEEAFVRCGGKRVDLLSEGGEEFYQSFRHRPLPGFRIYPASPQAP
jgi:ribosomal protein S18 acetylase RimI-like enzyme